MGRRWDRRANIPPCPTPSADEVLKFVKDFANEGEALIAGTNAPATREVIENTLRGQGDRLRYRSARDARSTLVRPRMSFSRTSRRCLTETDVNLVLYSYPYKDGVEIGFDILDALADDPRVLGIKESSGSLQRAIDIHARYHGRIDLISGSDDIALDFMFWGADAWICGPANCMAKACVDLDRTFRSGDLAKAREKMIVLYKAMNILESGKFVQKVKYGCELQGQSVGNCRAPLGELTADEKAEFRKAMEPILNW